MSRTISIRKAAFLNSYLVSHFSFVYQQHSSSPVQKFKAIVVHLSVYRCPLFRGWKVSCSSFPVKSYHLKYRLNQKPNAREISKVDSRCVLVLCGIASSKLTILKTWSSWIFKVLLVCALLKERESMWESWKFCRIEWTWEIGWESGEQWQFFI